MLLIWEYSSCSCNNLSISARNSCCTMFYRSLSFSMRGSVSILVSSSTQCAVASSALSGRAAGTLPCAGHLLGPDGGWGCAVEASSAANGPLRTELGCRRVAVAVLRPWRMPFVARRKLPKLEVWDEFSCGLGMSRRNEIFLLAATLPLRTWQIVGRLQGGIHAL